jgi:hypothetical protein
MALDVPGSLKKAKLNNNIYTFVDELFANAIDSFLIRKQLQKDVTDLKITFSSEITDADFLGTQKNLTIRCSDNGIGLGPDQTKAFVTKDTSYKDYLKIQGIGECKGSGRIQYLLYFSHMNILSIYKNGNEFISKTLDFSDKSTKEIDEKSFKEQKTSDTNVGFEIKLSALKDEPFVHIQKQGNIEALFSAEKIRNHVLVFFLQRLVTLKDQIGNFEIIFESTYKDETQTTKLKAGDLPDITATKMAVATIADSNKKVEFKVSHYKLEKNKFDLTKNTVAMCAKSTIVSDITKKYLKTKTLENNHLGGNYHIILIESDYLDLYVSEQRDGFMLPKTNSEKDQSSFYEELLSLDDIYNSIEDIIQEMLSPPDWNKENIINMVAQKYGISSAMLADVDVRIHFGDTEESVVKRVLTKYQEKIIKDTSDIFDIQNEIKKLKPDSEDFRKKINEISWKHTSSIKSVDMANLSQLVVRRAAIIEVLRLAVAQELGVQKTKPKDKKKNDESLIHNIFFPMKKDSLEVEDHDIWILNEDYNYFDYISSDKQLSQMQLDGITLFDADIDIELEKIMKKNSDDNERKRPDIAIFGKDGSAIIIEFKAPQVPLDEHTSDLMEYAQLLAAKSKGKLKQFYGYLIGTEVNPNRLRGYTRFANNKGWFGTENVIEHTTNTRLGELYSEILYYNDIADKAEMKLEVYKKKLGLVGALSSTSKA